MTDKTKCEDNALYLAVTSDSESACDTADGARRAAWHTANNMTRGARCSMRSTLLSRATPRQLPPMAQCTAPPLPRQLATPREYCDAACGVVFCLGRDRAFLWLPAQCVYTLSSEGTVTCWLQGEGLSTRMLRVLWYMIAARGDGLADDGTLHCLGCRWLSPSCMRVCVRSEPAACQCMSACARQSGLLWHLVMQTCHARSQA